MTAGYCEEPLRQAEHGGAETDEPDRPGGNKREFETMTQKDKQALLRGESQAEGWCRTAEQLEEGHKATIGAAALDRMPRKGAACRAGWK